MTNQKTAVVTGGVRGIGYAIANQLAADGYAVCVLYISPRADVGAIVDGLSVHGQPAMAERCDISDPTDRANALRKILDAWGRVDVLVNNAGIAPRVRADLLETTEESFDEVLNVNLKGSFFFTQAVAKIMIKQTEQNPDADMTPKIINISSVSAYAASINRGEYCISKAGIGMMTALFADRLAEYGIGVYEIRPGIIATDMTEPVRDKYDRLIAQGLTPIKRWGQPQDVADAVSVICGGKLYFSTGEIINVDGGFHLRRL